LSTPNGGKERRQALPFQRPRYPAHCGHHHRHLGRKGVFTATIFNKYRSV
jgi:hypothetical protein